MKTVLAPMLALALLPIFGATPGSAETPVGAGGPDEPGGIETFVVNGDLASISDYPYYAAIVDRAEADPYQAQFCGGAIVSSRLVVTAAHCVDSFDPIDVIVGTDRLAVGYGERIQVDQIHVHPDWSPATARNDVAVLRLASPTSQRPVRMVPAASDFRWGKGAPARVAGFGCISYLGDFGFCAKYPNRLYAANLPVGADSWCRSVLGGDFHAGSMLCAGSTSSYGQAPDACYGDSGGPLVVAGPGGWSSPLLVGVVSWGPGCGDSPSAYTRLAAYRSWLKSKGVPMVKLFGGGPAYSVGGSFVPLVGDFDGDGRDDIFWYAPGTGVDVLWRGTAAGFRRVKTFNVNGRFTPLVGDFDGDGRDDIFWYAPGSGTDVLWRGTTKGFRRHSTYSVSRTFLPVVGDFDGDGRDDIFWYAPGPAVDRLWRGTSSGFRGVTVAQQDGYYRPHAGDFNGDGRTDVVWYADGGRDLLWRAAGSGWTRYDLSLPGSRLPAIGDFNGDGRDDLFLYGPGSAPDTHLRGAR